MATDVREHTGDALYIFPEREGDPIDLEPLDQDERNALALAVQVDLGNAKGQRFLKDQTLDYYNDMYEMNVADRDTPYQDAPNLCVPLVQIVHRGIFSKVAAAVFVPRLYTSTPLDDNAATYSYSIENYYNGEWLRKKMLKDHLETLELALRDSVACLEVLWEEQQVERKIAVLNQNGEKEVKTIQVQEKKGVYYHSVAYRDLIISPATAKGPQRDQGAESVYRRVMLNEQDLWDRVESGEFYKEEVERIIQQHSAGQSDLTSTNPGIAQYKEGGTISPGDTGNTSPAQGLKARGIFEVWRVHTCAYDLDKDGKFEENVVWYYELFPSTLGASTYKYWHGKRPFAVCKPIPRCDRYEGFALPELERGLQEEVNARHNQRGMDMDLRTFPGLWQTDSATLMTPNDPIGPNARWKVLSKDDVGVIDLGAHNPVSFEEEGLLMSYAMRVIGLESAGLPLLSSKQPNMQQRKAGQMDMTTAIDMLAMNVREFCEEVLWMTNKLNIQYMDDTQENELGGKGLQTVVDNESYTVPYEAFLQKYMLTVAGTQGALDKQGRTENVRILYALLMQNPLVQGNLERVWAATTLVLEDANLPAYTKYIGTVDDAKQQQQAQAQAAKQQHDEQLQLQLASHSKNPSPEQKPSPNGMAATPAAGGPAGP